MSEPIMSDPIMSDPIVNDDAAIDSDEEAETPLPDPASQSWWDDDDE